MTISKTGVPLTMMRSTPRARALHLGRDILESTIGVVVLLVGTLRAAYKAWLASGLSHRSILFKMQSLIRVYGNPRYPYPSIHG